MNPEAKAAIIARHEQTGKIVRQYLKDGQIEMAAQYAGSHFFDRDSMRFFNSRLAPDTYCLPDGSALFITSEQFKPLYGAPSPRGYTVRLAFWATGSEGFTITEPTPPGATERREAFQFFPTLARARTFARKLKAAGLTARDLVAPYYFDSKATLGTPPCPLKEA